MAITAAILGASGFAGGELLRCLSIHPAIDIIAAGASTQAGKRLTEVFPGLRSLSHISFCSIEEALKTDADVLFSSLPHGQSGKLLSRAQADAVVDLAGDFRLKDPDMYSAWYGQAHPDPSSLSDWVYGLTEFHRSEIATGGAAVDGERGSKKVANPGCYAAACLLALGPLAEGGIIDISEIHISALSGVSGAGRAQGQGFDFVSANENVRAYKPTGHNHIGEIEQELSLLAGEPANVSFVPHLVPMDRGIYVAAAVRAKGPSQPDRFAAALRERYDNEPFVTVLEPPLLPETKRVSRTNFAEVGATADLRTGKVLAFAAIDNLGKGAAGQAIQNANLMLGLAETTGLLAEGLTA